MVGYIRNHLKEYFMYQEILMLVSKEYTNKIVYVSFYFLITCMCASLCICVQTGTYMKCICMSEKRKS